MEKITISNTKENEIKENENEEINKKDKGKMKEKAKEQGIEIEKQQKNINEDNKQVEQDKGKEKEKEKRSFRKDSKGISKKIVNLFYPEVSVNSWKIATEFNRIFNIKSLQFITYYWSKLKNSRKYHITVFLLTLTSRNIAELNKNSNFEKLLYVIEKDCYNPKMNMDKKFMLNILSILYTKLLLIEQDENKKKEISKRIRPFKFNLSRLQNIEFKYKCNSPLFAYINHDKNDEIKFNGSIKWKSNEKIPSEEERMKNYKKLNYLKNRNVDQFLKRKSIFEPTVVVKQKQNSFLRSRHNFNVNKSMSISVQKKDSKSMLASNHDQVKKLVLLEKEDVDLLKKEEQRRIEEAKQREAEEKKRRKEEEKNKKRSRRRSSSIHIDTSRRSSTKNSSKDSAKSSANSKVSNRSTPSTPKSNNNSEVIVIDDDNNNINDNSNFDITDYNTDIEDDSGRAFPSPRSVYSVVSSPQYSPKSPYSQYSPTLSERLLLPNSPALSSTSAFDISGNEPLSPLFTRTPLDPSGSKSPSSTLAYYYSINNAEVNEDYVLDYIYSIPPIKTSFNFQLETFDKNKYLWENKDENGLKDDLDRMLNDKWLTEEKNKIMDKYYDLEDEDYNSYMNIDESNNQESNFNDESYKKSIYLKIHNHDKIIKKKREKIPLKYNFNYFPSVDEKYPAPIDSSSLTNKEKELFNKYRMC